MAVVKPRAKYLLAIQASRLAMTMQQERLELTRCRMNPPELCQSCITLPRIIENSLPNEFIHQSQFETSATYSARHKLTCYYMGQSDST